MRRERFAAWVPQAGRALRSRSMRASRVGPRGLHATATTAGTRAAACRASRNASAVRPFGFAAGAGKLGDGFARLPAHRQAGGGGRVGQVTYARCCEMQGLRQEAGIGQKWLCGWRRAPDALLVVGTHRPRRARTLSGSSCFHQHLVMWRSTREHVDEDAEQLEMVRTSTAMRSKRSGKLPCRDVAAGASSERAF